MDDIVKDFLIESNENLDRLDQKLVKLESEPFSKELLASIFRTIHTIKGSCGFLGFARLEKLTHAGESLLSRLRDGQLVLNPDITTGLLAMVDAVRQMLAEIQKSGQDGEEDYSSLIRNLARLQEQSVTVSADDLPSSMPRQKQNAGKKTDAKEASARAGHAASEPRPVEKNDQASRPQTADAEPSTAPPEIASPPAPREEKHGVTEDSPHPPQADVHASSSEFRPPDATVETIRVGVNLLDNLMNLVGELVLARNQLLQFSNTTEDGSFHAVSQRMNLIATELQEEVMKTRMQPIGNVWSKFPRTVRDLARDCGKQVRLEMEGQDTELDRTIIEAIKDPLTHLVRNSMDHGFESPEARAQAGKDPTGTLTLRAFHEGGQVNIEISDDGAGLNADRIRLKAIERGVVSAQQAANMPERDAFNLIFLPGFSTAEKVTKVSGRGVGMDVVKTNVEKIGGAVDIQSSPGKGTTVRVKIPLTLAIIPALVATCNGERFAIPQVSLSELVRLDSEDQTTGIEMVHGVPVYRLRGRLLPLVYLDRELGIPSKADAASATNIVVLQAEDRQFGLIVDEIIDTEEIVVKPLSKQLKGISAYSGATIMGDGKVALILDVPGLAQRARVVAEGREAGHEEAGVDATKTVHHDHALLLAENGADNRVAIPLSTVARLEEFPATVVEHSGTQEVMQYRGQIIPLVRLSQILPAGTQSQEEQAASIQVVVYSGNGRTVGLVVDRIVDIVEADAAVETLVPRTGVVGSFVTQQHVTDLLDVPSIIQAAIPGLLQVPAEGERH